MPFGLEPGALAQAFGAELDLLGRLAARFDPVLARRLTDPLQIVRVNVTGTW